MSDWLKPSDVAKPLLLGAGIFAASLFCYLADENGLRVYGEEHPGRTPRIRTDGPVAIIDCERASCKVSTTYIKKPAIAQRILSAGTTIFSRALHPQLR
ncbi:hypothetical protein A3C28_03010 [Candidatus Roizmanbacteria bacterium RIFCSPHIGHO2_02_FULL_39_9]|uniref:Uncharacterized protein n=2 Tax=Candidatus Roizmaniibacteriota TaxID=1752723 RepID=A0A1F7HVZ3_9BACT|nr:MAG: hypothetical protein A3C28_03010 [Candidatus Roizmanbacteria bacterium RIFCSPHIGHO2_02_FULL_39_9]OGK35206.1 MAG: hypothetical protein A3F60_03790 [Candidatus Roizmanbacteria bacterium RIFCSPHIGHO2_12_FULL_39_8]